MARANDEQSKTRNNTRARQDIRTTGSGPRSAASSRPDLPRPTKRPVQTKQERPLTQEEKMAQRHVELLDRRKRELEEKERQQRLQREKARREAEKREEQKREEERKIQKQVWKNSPKGNEGKKRISSKGAERGRSSENSGIRFGKFSIKRRFFFLCLTLLCLSIGAIILSIGVFSGYKVQYGKLEERRAYSGILLRSESITRTDLCGMANIYASEGAAVHTGDVLMDVYGNGYSNRVLSELESTQARIQEILNYSQASDVVDPQMNEIKEEIASLQKQIQQAFLNKNTALLHAAYEELRQKMQDKQSYLGSSILSQQNNELRSLVESQNRLLNTIESWKTTYTAQSDGLLSYAFDGYESYINLSSLETLSVDAVRSVLKDEKPASSEQIELYRIVNPDLWYLLLAVKDTDWKLGVGENCQVYFSGFEDTAYQAVVNRINRKNGELMVALEMKTPIGDLINLRKVNVQVGTYMEGMMVPTSALTKQGDYDGVILAKTDAFVPVHIICRDGDTALVLPLQAGALDRKMKIKE